MSAQGDPLLGCKVPPSKITDYLLDRSHPVAAAKAAFFASFGFSLAEWRLLAEALAAHPRRNTVEGTIATPYGLKYVVRCTVETPDRRNPCIVTIWMKEGNAPASLVTAYPG